MGVLNLNPQTAGLPAVCHFDTESAGLCVSSDAWLIKVEFVSKIIMQQ
jgi:hypothetical protein